MVKLIITEDEENQRLDKFLKKYLKNAPLSHIYKMIRADIRLNGRRGKPDTILSRGDELALYISGEDETLFKRKSAAPKAMRQFGIAYEDENLLIVEKPMGLLTHGDSLEKKNTLANQVAGYLSANSPQQREKGRAFSPAPANRLDRNTTGLVLFGKNSAALRSLNAALRNGGIRKYYLTIVAGELRKELVLKGSLEKNHAQNKALVLREGDEAGKSIVTLARPVENGKGFTFVEIELVTGRSHQIRAHLAHEGFPIIGDPKYGDPTLNLALFRRYGLGAQILHAWRLLFDQPEASLAYLTGKEVRARLPKEFAGVKAALIGGGRDDPPPMSGRGR